MLFLSVRGFFDYAGPDGHSRLSRPTVLPSPLRQKVGILIQRFFEAQSPRPPIPLSMLRTPSHDVARKTRGQDGFATLLSCRALSSPTTCRFIPALDVIPRNRNVESWKIYEILKVRFTVSVDRKSSASQVWTRSAVRCRGFSITRFEGSRWCLRRTRLVMEKVT